MVVLPSDGETRLLLQTATICIDLAGLHRGGSQFWYELGSSLSRVMCRWSDMKGDVGYAQYQKL
jgi:hypothetical protein